LFSSSINFSFSFGDTKTALLLYLISSLSTDKAGEDKGLLELCIPVIFLVSIHARYLLLFVEKITQSVSFIQLHCIR